MTADDLSTPLGHAKRRPRRRALARFVPRLLAGALGAALTVFGGWVLLVDDPFGGEPYAVVTPTVPQVHSQATPNAKEGHPSGSGAAEEKPSPAHRETVTIIDGMSGKRQEVAIGRDSARTAPGPNSPPTAPGPGTAAGPVQASPTRPGASIDQHLIETTPYGAIPKIGPDGARPADAYARPAQAAAGDSTDKAGVRIALVIGGLGISASGMTEALAKLPGPVTLAFSPYTVDGERWVDRARGEGHEILLQIPMEPSDYPDNDPGPRTLLTSVAADQNIDRLHWFMSRFPGYVGVANYMGARFTGNEPAVAPVLGEVAKRGLIYFDDGSSTRSLASQLIGANNGSFARADVTLDAVPTSAEIDNALARLETLARQRGVAIGIAGPLPLVIDRVSRWAKTIEGRGMRLVPVSAVASKPKST